MFSTSSDILYLVLAVCVLALTVFICWAIYYFIASVQRIHRLIRKIENGVIKTEELLDLAKGKLQSSGAFFLVLGELAKKALDFAKEKKEKKTGAKKK